MNGINPAHIPPVNTATAAAKQSGGKDVQSSPKAGTDKVSISKEGREAPTEKHEISVVEDHVKILPEVRESILMQARQRLMEGYYFSSEVTEGSAERIIRAFAAD